MLKLKVLGAAAALIMTTSFCFAGCSFNLFSHMNYTYDHGDNYTAGDREIDDEITKISIDYVSGTVTLKGEDTDEISITETANVDLTEDQKVHTWVDGNTLYIKFCASSKNLNFNGAFDDIFEKYTNKAKLDKVKTTNLGSMFELNFLVSLKKDADQKAMIDEIRVRNGNLTVAMGTVTPLTEEL